LPLGMPGMGEEIDGAMQQAPQPARQFSNVAESGIAMPQPTCLRSSA